MRHLFAGRDVHRRLRAMILVVALASAGCNSSPLLAPTDATMVLVATPLLIPVGGSAEVTALVTKSGGQAAGDGTAVYFSSSLGDITPREAETKGGKATVRFLAGSTPGTAVLRAYSGSVEAAPLEITVGG
jgi:hypothetical protein